MTPTDLQAVIARVGTHPDLKLTKDCWRMRERCGLGEVWRFPLDSTVSDLMLTHMQRALDEVSVYVFKDRSGNYYVDCAEHDALSDTPLDGPEDPFPTRESATVAAVLAAFEEKRR
jgi:hypothetical protein